MATGIEIMKNDVYANAKIRFSDVRENLGMGVLIRGAFFEAEFSEIKQNHRHGFEYNPTYTTVQAQEIRQGIHDCTMITNGMVLLVANEGYQFLCTQYKSQVENIMYEAHLRVRSSSKVNTVYLF